MRDDYSLFNGLLAHRTGAREGEHKTTLGIKHYTSSKIRLYSRDILLTASIKRTLFTMNASHVSNIDTHRPSDVGYFGLVLAAIGGISTLTLLLSLLMKYCQAEHQEQQEQREETATHQINQLSAP